MKKLSSLVLTMIVLSSSVISANAQATGIQVQVNGQVQSFDQTPIIVNDFTLVPMRDIFETLHAKVEWDGNTQKVTAKKDDRIITLVIGSKTGFVDGKPIPLDVEARIIEGRTMVPLRFVSEALGADVKWDSKTKTVSISTEKADSGETKGLNAPTLTLTKEHAIELAVKESNRLKTAQADIERADEGLKEASDNVEFLPGSGGNEAASQLFTGWNRAQTSYFMSKKQYEMAEEAIEYSVKVSYNDILQKQKAKEVADLALENQELKKRVVQAKAETGMASAYELTQAQNTLNELKAKQQAAEKALEDAYVTLNQMTGMKPGDRYSLVELPTYEPMEKVDLEMHVSQVTSSSSAIWLAEQQVKLAKLNVKYYTFNSPTAIDTYRQKEIDLDKAQYSAADTKKQLETSIRSMYYNIKQMEDQYKVLQANLTKAEDALGVLQTKFDLGMATSAELFEAKVGVEQIKEQIFGITAQLDTLKIAFEKPWVLGVN